MDRGAARRVGLVEGIAVLVTYVVAWWLGFWTFSRKW